MTDEKREYLRQWRQKRKREKGGWITKAYGNMRNRNRTNFGKELDFTKDEFEDWLDGNYGKLFDELFRAYVGSNCEKDLALLLKSVVEKRKRIKASCGDM